MLRHVMIGLAAATLVGAMLVPDDAAARAGRGGARISAGGGARIAGNRTHVSRPIARPGVGYGRYAGRGVGWGVGAAAVGAAAAGAYYGNYGYSDYYNNNNCYRDSYGQVICPNQYQYQSPYQYQYRY